MATPSSTPTGEPPAGPPSSTSSPSLTNSQPSSTPSSSPSSTPSQTPTSTPSSSTTPSSTSTPSSSTPSSSTTSSSTPIPTSLSTSVSGSHVITVTVTQSAPPGTSSRAPTNTNNNGFFANKGAVAGVFTVVGIAALVVLGLIVAFFLRRRRRRRWDRYGDDAENEANAATAGRVPQFDDFDNDGYMAPSSHNATTPSGVGGDASLYPGSAQWDPYSSNAYPMSQQTAPSVYTTTTAGMAGLGARGAGGYNPNPTTPGTGQDQYYGGPHSDGHSGYPASDPSSGGYPAQPGVDGGYPPAQVGQQEYYDPYTNAAPAAGAAAVGAGAAYHSDTSPPPRPPRQIPVRSAAANDDAYGGTAENDEPLRTPPFLGRNERQNSTGTANDDGGASRPLRVANS